MAKQYKIDQPPILAELVLPDTGEVLNQQVVIKPVKATGDRYTQYTKTFMAICRRWPKSTQCVAFDIADRMQRSNCIAASVTETAKITGLARQTVRAALSFLETVDFLRPATDDAKLSHYYMVNPYHAAKTSPENLDRLRVTWHQLRPSSAAISNRRKIITNSMDDIKQQIAKLSARYDYLDQLLTTLDSNEKAASAQTADTAQETPASTTQDTL